jgi:uncharacterized protein DUF2628
MPVYTVHAPLIAGTARPAADRFVFVRDGFHVWAALAAVLWLAFNRLWLALLGYIVVMLAVTAGLWLLHVGSDVRLVVFILIALLMGSEAASLQRWTLSRGKWRQLDVVVAKNRDDAERRFFDRWVEGRTAAADSPSIDRGAPPPVRPFPRAGQGDIMGLFPQPGTPR